MLQLRVKINFKIPTNLGLLFLDTSLSDVKNKPMKHRHTELLGPNQLYLVRFLLSCCIWEEVTLRTGGTRVA